MYRLIAAVLLGVGAMVGSFFYGVRYERNQAKVAGLEVFAGKLDKALDLANDFVKLGTEFVNKKAEVRVVTNTVVRKQVEYVKANAVPDVTVPAFILGLRACQIDRVRQAAGYPVSGRSDGSLCASGTTEQRPGDGADLERRR